MDCFRQRAGRSQPSDVVGGELRWVERVHGAFGGSGEGRFKANVPHDTERHHLAPGLLQPGVRAQPVRVRVFEVRVRRVEAAERDGVAAAASAGVDGVR